jgi:hypothetical protein
MKTTKKSASKSGHKRAVKDLALKPAKGGAIHGGNYPALVEIQISKDGGASSSDLFKHVIGK